MHCVLLRRPLSTCLCFFCWYGARRDLHSFPTRRSSDLVIVQMDGVSGVCVYGIPDAKWGEAIKAVVELRADARYTALMRSEEHTSELQSRGHLVCRLLLEKKKRRRSHGRRSRLEPDRIP